MKKYSANFNITLSVSYEFEANSEDEARALIEMVNAQDVFVNKPDGLDWQWDEVDSQSINMSAIDDDNAIQNPKSGKAKLYC